MLMDLDHETVSALESALIVAEDSKMRAVSYTHLTLPTTERV